MHVIENEWLKVSIKPAGAELTGLFNKKTGLEYLWQSDPAFWAKQSPGLFPIVGALRNNQYRYKGQLYQLNRHGFARENIFMVEESTANTVTFLLQATPETLLVYPFDFKLCIRYKLEKDRLYVDYEVSNGGASRMYFSIGAHPAFRIPLVSGTQYDDYYLQFEKTENADRWLITADGLISSNDEQLLEQTNLLPLEKSLFSRDAIVFKDLQSERVSLLSKKTPHGLTMHFAGFPFFGIWAARNADFVCLEPWCGIADSEESSQEFTKKEGIHVLGKGEEFKRGWSIRCF